jgi:hypothetical protein
MLVQYIMLEIFISGCKIPSISEGKITGAIPVQSFGIQMIALGLHMIAQGLHVKS